MRLGGGVLGGCVGVYSKVMKWWNVLNNKELEILQPTGLIMQLLIKYLTIFNFN